MSISDMVFDGAFASACATVVSNPFDVVRTRMQLQGQMMKAGEYEVVYKNLFQAMGKIAKEESLIGLQKGLAPAICWQVTLNGVRMGMYPSIKNEISEAVDRIHVSYLTFQGRTQTTGAKPLSETNPFLICVSAGALCGVMGAIAASPFALVKTRLQSEHGAHLKAQLSSAGHTARLAEATIGTQFHYTGVWDALKKIYKKGGVKGLWHGGTLAAQRTMIGSAVQLTSYDYCRTLWANALGYPVSDARMHILAAINASLFVVLFMNPFDVVMTRSYNTHIADKAQRAAGVNPIGSANIFKQVLGVYRVEGVRGMYKGSGALFARSAPHSVATFVVLEWVRKMRETHTPDRAYTSGSNLSKKSIDVFQEKKGLNQKDSAVASVAVGGGVVSGTAGSGDRLRGRDARPARLTPSPAE